MGWDCDYPRCPVVHRDFKVISSMPEDLRSPRDRRQNAMVRAMCCWKWAIRGSCSHTECNGSPRGLGRMHCSSLHVGNPVYSGPQSGGPPRLPSVDCVLRTRCDGISPAAQMESAGSAPAYGLVVLPRCRLGALLNRPRPQKTVPP